MRYPNPLPSNATIAVIAPSSGVTGEFLMRLDHAIEQLKQRGYTVWESPSLRHNEKLVSASKEIRAQEFMTAYLDPRIDLIYPPWGGELGMEILPLLDWDALRGAPPKWILGFSDITTFLFTLTLVCDVATAHGPNLLDFGMDPVHPSVDAALLGLAESKWIRQTSLPLHQTRWPDIEQNGLAPYLLSEEVVWKIHGGATSAQIQGRLIGGCLDVLCKLLGTPYAPVQDFIKRYRNDGILWYFETVEMNAADIHRTLWQMTEMGLFEGATGIVFGRKDGYSDTWDFTFLDALEGLALDVPIVYDADIGHIPPQILMINGALATIEVNDGLASIVQVLP